MLERKIIHSHISRGRVAVDFGGGYGRLTSVLLNYFDHVFLADFSLRNLRNAIQNLNSDKITYVACDIRKPLFVEGSIDFGICIRVLHHYSDLSFISSLGSSLKLGGKLIMNFNNRESPLFMLGLINSFFEHKRSAVNPFRDGSQRIEVDFGKRDVYFSTLPDILAAIPSNMKVLRTEGYGLFHNTFFEKHSDYFEIMKITDIEMMLGKMQVISRLFPDIFLFLEKYSETENISEENPMNLLRCSKCYSPLSYRDDSFECDQCFSIFKISDGIIDLR